MAGHSGRGALGLMAWPADLPTDAQVRLHRVALVFELEFAVALPALLRTCHVWLVDSPSNTSAANRIWTGEQDGPPPAPAQATLKPRLSTFLLPKTTPEAALATALDLVEDHHDESGAGPAVSEVLIIGMPLSAAVVAILAHWGYTEVQGVSMGTLALRPSRRADE